VPRRTSALEPAGGQHASRGAGCERACVVGDIAYRAAVRIDVDGVLFDSDGVLVDSERLVDLAWRQLAVEFDLELPTLIAERSGVRSVDTLSRHLSGDTLAKAVRRLEDLEVALAGQVNAVPGAIGLSAALPGGSWTIVTSASRRLARARWSGAGLVEPGGSVTADQVTSGKPDPEPYLLAAMLLGLDPTRCVVFEDSPSGGEAARAAGAIPIAIGAAPWAFEPLARIDDLTAVEVTASSTHRLALTFDRSGT
jgi:sugar-phosphatase